VCRAIVGRQFTSKANEGHPCGASLWNWTAFTGWPLLPNSHDAGIPYSSGNLKQSREVLGVPPSLHGVLSGVPAVALAYLLLFQLVKHLEDQLSHCCSELHKKQRAVQKLQ